MINLIYCNTDSSITNGISDFDAEQWVIENVMNADKETNIVSN